MDNKIVDNSYVKTPKKNPLRLSKSLNLSLAPLKLSHDIKELSNTALLSSIELFNSTTKINNFHSNSFTSLKSLNESLNNKENTNDELLSQQVGTTNRLTEFNSQTDKNVNKSPTRSPIIFANNSSSDANDELNEPFKSGQSFENDTHKVEKNKHKRFALAWVRKRVVKKTYNVYHGHGHTNHRKNYSPSSEAASAINSSTSNSKTLSNRTGSKKINRIDWTENAKQGVHIWSDVSNQSNESCYLSEPDALEFHNLSSQAKCASQSKNVDKKKCSICKIIVHETCIDTLQKYVKCRTTFREATNKKKSLKDKEYNASNSSTVNVNLHHWLCRKYDEEKFGNRCQGCSKSYTNRFGLQTSQSIVSCSWCKASYHLKCFSQNSCKLECNFGEFNQLVVPPNWIVKSNNKNSFRSSFMRTHLRSSKRHFHQEQASNHPIESSNLLAAPSNTIAATSKHSHSSFIIRPTPSLSGQNIMIKPLLVLINPKSGGKLGYKLIKKFTWLLNARQVFDLTQPGCPKLPLYLYRNVPNLRVLVGGGDGTVGWVLSVIDQIKFLTSPPSVAVLPLGTGNDLARALNWGGGYTDESLTKMLSRVLESRTTRLDRWKVFTRPNPDLNLIDKEEDKEENVVSKLKNDVMNNYFSIGADAHVCLEFHERREANHQKFSSRWFNLLQYLEAGSKDMIKKTWKDLTDFTKLECDGKNFTDFIKSRGYHCIIFLNIPKYSSGTNPWGNSSDNNFQPQAINDGRFEVIGCFTSTLAKFQFGGNGERICQAKHVKLTTSTNIPIQIDGEPAKLCPSIIEITHKNQAYMLEHVKYNTDSPVFGYQPSIHRNYEVKCILMDDYETCRKDHDILKKKATYIGAICTSNLTDPLNEVRNTINLLLKNCANGFYASKWTFLNGEEFYRVSDDSDECLLDLVSFDEVIYILDESSKFSNPILKDLTKSNLSFNDDTLCFKNDASNKSKALLTS